jgi:predicted secreted protein
MSLTGSFVVFVILWWLILFIILPRDINSQKEKDCVIEGTDPGAPTNPRIIKKLIITTVITSILFAIIYFLNYFDILNIRRILS